MVTFKAVMVRRTSDKDGESRLTFAVPASDCDAVDSVGRQVGEILIVTVIREKELEDTVQEDAGATEGNGD